MDPKIDGYGLHNIWTRAVDTREQKADTTKKAEWKAAKYQSTGVNYKSSTLSKNMPDIYCASDSNFVAPVIDKEKKDQPITIDFQLNSMAFKDTIPNTGGTGVYPSSKYTFSPFQLGIVAPIMITTPAIKYQLTHFDPAGAYIDTTKSVRLPIKF